MEGDTTAQPLTEQGLKVDGPEVLSVSPPAHDRNHPNFPSRQLLYDGMRESHVVVQADSQQSLIGVMSLCLLAVPLSPGSWKRAQHRHLSSDHLSDQGQYVFAFSLSLQNSAHVNKNFSERRSCRLAFTKGADQFLLQGLCVVTLNKLQVDIICFKILYSLTNANISSLQFFNFMRIHGSTNEKNSLDKLMVNYKDLKRILSLHFSQMVEPHLKQWRLLKLNFLLLSSAPLNVSLFKQVYCMQIGHLVSSP